MARDRFIDPSTGETYSWPVNHSEETDNGKTRSITHSATTNNVGAVRQQGDDGPLTLKWSGTILHAAQHRAMWSWFERCRSQTIYLYDFADQGYEVQITNFAPVRKRTLRNSRDPSIPYHYWTYEIEMTVYRMIQGDLHDAGVTA